MSALPAGRVGVKIKAVLSILHKAGHNVAAVERQAENAMRTGRPAALAYEAAVGQHLKANPGIKPTVVRVARLIDHSDPASIARYDQALNSYIAGDEGPVDALAPMMRADMQALAVRDGELSVDDAVAGRVDWAGMGIPGFADQGGAGQGAPAPAVQSEAPQGSPRAAPASAWSNQVGVTASPTGVRVGAAAERWDRAERVSYGDAAPLAAGLAARSGPQGPAALSGVGAI